MQYSWRHALLVLAALVLVVSWPVVFFFLREPTAAEVAAQAARREKGLRFAFPRSQA